MKIYQKLVNAIVPFVMIGCSSRALEIPSELAHSQCEAEKREVEVSLEAKLKSELLKAQNELAKVKVDAQKTCDARVREVEIRSASTPAVVELPQEITVQFPKMDQPIHKLLKAMVQDKYGLVATPRDFMISEADLPLLYNNITVDNVKNISFVDACPRAQREVNLPAEYTPCTVGLAVKYSEKDNSFEISRWKTHYVKEDAQKVDDAGYIGVTESISFRGIGQLLSWEEVDKVVIQTQKTNYEETSFAPKDISEDIAKRYGKELEMVLKEGEQFAERALKEMMQSYIR